MGDSFFQNSTVRAILTGNMYLCGIVIPLAVALDSQITMLACIVSFAFCPFAYRWYLWGKHSISVSYVNIQQFAVSPNKKYNVLILRSFKEGLSMPLLSTVIVVIVLSIILQFFSPLEVKESFDLGSFVCILLAPFLYVCCHPFLAEWMRRSRGVVNVIPNAGFLVVIIIFWIAQHKILFDNFFGLQSWYLALIFLGLLPIVYLGMRVLFFRLVKKQPFENEAIKPFLRERTFHWY